MEFLKRKHFSLWIIFLVSWLVDEGYGLQGVPTWMCLGIKSPFIEFRNEVEILANTSISLNITKDEQVLMHEESLKKLGTFIKPVDLRNSTTGFVKSNLTKKIPPTPAGRRRSGTENPIAEEMDRKDIELLEEETDPNVGFPGLSNDDRKFIVPMALKNPTSEPKKAAPATNDFSTNIDDLKNHILMLQNMTKNDKSFQSKFVVFPSIQRERNSTHPRPLTHPSTTAAPKRIVPVVVTPKIPEPAKSKALDYDEPHDDYHKEISIIPQVLLLNDQTPPDEEEEDPRRGGGGQKETRVTYSRRRNFRKTSTTMTTTTIVTTPAATVEKPRRNPKRQRGGNGERRNKKRQQNCKNVDTPRCQRQRGRQLALSLNINKTLHMTSGERPFPSTDPRNKTEPRAAPVEQDHFWLGGGRPLDDDQKLSRSVRSHHIRRNAGGARSSYEGTQASRDFIIPVGNVINNNQSMAYKEAVDLNPDLCYRVDGMTYGQQKLCVLHTSIMPAISRGARSAIQECQHQFKNRRWNCSTTQDNTVFGPMSSIGSPEMAFIHALAAATVTSFIARSCRDGQLASCGCSRSARPKQLHDDWTWGGCGDDLEFAYKFAQDFIDIRERERKRGTRGLVSVPTKNKLEEKLLSESASGGTADGSGNGTSTGSDNERHKNGSSTQSKDDSMIPFKPEDLLELQEKITKEILNSKLQEKEMLELQEKINREILNSKVFNLEHHAIIYGKKQHQRAGPGHASSSALPRMKSGISAKARSLMNLHNNEAGRRAVIKKTRITCKCHGVSGSCSLITCWQQLSSIREIGDYLREKYDAATQVKLNKRGRLQVRDPRYKVPTAHDLVYLDESPDWCRNSRQLQWPGTHGRVCNKTSSGLDGCAILCCGRGYNTKTIVVRERCNCKFQWCCQVKCEVCVKVLEEHTCK